MQYLALATDYDGTLAHDSQVTSATIESLERLIASGRKVIMVTGRELPELKTVFPRLDLCELVVAENGALLYWPSNDREEVLGEPPPPEFLEQIKQRGVQAYSQGRVVFATWRPQETILLEVIQQLGLGYQIIFNKHSVMVLPSSINKASGLKVALERLQIDAGHVVGVGDAENDHSFLEMCGVAVAVENALPALKDRCDIVTKADHGAGVSELIEHILADDLQGLGIRRPRAATMPRVVQS